MIKRWNDLKHFLQYRYRIARSLKHRVAYVPPHRVQIEITNRCNLRCLMCDRWQWGLEDRKTNTDMDTQTLLVLIRDLAGMGVKEILLTGGEPLLHRSIRDLATEISRLGMIVSLFTNGTRINRDIAETLGKANAKVFVSIDGARDTHDMIRGVKGTYDIVFAGIRQLALSRNDIRGKGEINVNYVVQKSNVMDVGPVYSEATRAGVDKVIYDIVHGRPEVVPDREDAETLRRNFSLLSESEAGRGKRFIIGDMLGAFLDGQIPIHDIQEGLPAKSLFLREPVPCVVAYRSSFIDSFGRVFPCCFCYFDNSPFHLLEKEREKFSLGNIFESKFSDVWFGRGGRYDSFRARMDPVSDTDVQAWCGQCNNYFSFRKTCRRIRWMDAVGLIG
jgi:MoaA/NifB/PqqE/SkfB family radical SAM enzyme